MIISMQKKNDYNDDVIDSMYEMCQDMLDVLDEHGGARNRYVKMKEDEIRKNIKLANAYDTAANKAGGEAGKRLGYHAGGHMYSAMTKADEIAKYTDGGTGSFNSYTGQSDYIHKRDNRRAYEHERRDSSAEGKRKFLNDVNKNDENYGAKPREPGTYKKIQDSKKAAVKETCYMILDMLDDMD